MKNKKIIVNDIGRTEFSYSWRYQESIFDKIIAQKVKNRVSEKKSNTKNYLILTEHNQEFHYKPVPYWLELSREL